MQNQVSFRQSLDESMEKQLIFYYSKFKLLDEQIVEDLLYCKTFRSGINTLIDPTWREQSTRLAYKIEPLGKKYLSYIFILDIMIFSWFNIKNKCVVGDLTEENFSNFNKLIKSSLDQFQYYEEELINISEEFFAKAKQFHKQIYNDLRAHDHKLNLQTDEKIQPLIVMRERSKSISKDDQFPQRNLKKLKNLVVQDSEIEDGLAVLVENLNLDDEFYDRVQISLHSRSNIVENSFGCDKLKHRKHQKQQEKIMEYMQKHYDFKDQDQSPNQWKTAKQFVVILRETQLKDGFMTKQKVRFISPAMSFYKMVCQLWITEKTQQKHLTFNWFAMKLKFFLKTTWNEKLLIPLFTAFQSLEQSLQTVQNSNTELNQIQLLKLVMKSFSEKMRDIWQQSIVQEAINMKNK